MKYPFDVVKIQDGLDIYWVAKSTCLKGCVGQGDTANEAINELEENEAMWLETAIDLGLDIPEVPVETELAYSGKLSLRMSRSVHKRAAEAAKREGISLNQFVNDAIVNYTAEIKTANYISAKVSQTAQNIGESFLSGITTSEISSVTCLIPIENRGTLLNYHLRN